MRDDVALIHAILRNNIYGVDINPASVEIARLALWLHTARGDSPLSSLESTIKTGNSLIAPDFYEGQMGYIGPSVWEMNDYGAGLRNLIMCGQNLEAWINFRAFQIFEEATIYCALQFFTKSANDAVKVAFATDGKIQESPWPNETYNLSYGRLNFGNRWLLLNGKKRDLIDRLAETCTRFDDPINTNGIYQGLINKCG